jgi:hypothetical protein
MNGVSIWKIKYTMETFMELTAHHDSFENFPSNLYVEN